MFNFSALLKIIAFIGVFIGGVALAKMWYAPAEVKREQSSTVLLEHVKTVAKLVSVEGQFAEVFSETDTKKYLGFITSSKRIILQIKAKVAVGYDLSKMKADADSLTKTIRLSNIPEPTILYVEPDVKYYDISNGVFNKFSPQDYTTVQQKAIELVRAQAAKSTLIKTAKEQGLNNINAIRSLTEALGWKMEVVQNATIPQ